MTDKPEATPNREYLIDRAAQAKAAIRKSERAIKQWRQVEGDAGQKVTDAGRFFLLGLLLAVAGIPTVIVSFRGLFLMFFLALPIRIYGLRQRDKARKMIKKIEYHIDHVEGELVKTEAQLATLSPEWAAPTREVVAIDQ